MSEGDDAGGNAQQEEPEDPLKDDIAAVFEEIGVWVEENDPEAKALMQAWETRKPRAILQAAEAAAKAKQARLNVAQAQPPTPAPFRNTVLAGSGQPSAINPIKDITDPDQLWKMAKKR